MCNDRSGDAAELASIV
uniref:Uncharacterized protein n=1 Tax=Arundo donax TaxID=35708 RepID=A0A0A9AJK4_ARUDO